jgi:hypothetical protein
VTDPSTESGAAKERPTAFVSYAQASPEWQRVVVQFTTALRTVGGVDAEMDIFHTSDHQQWTAFGPEQIRTSDFILVAVDPAYKARWSGTNEGHVGAGAAREAAAIKSIFEKGQQEFLRRVKVILLPGADKADIPDDLLGFGERFGIKSFDEAGLEALLRSIWGKPAFPKPPLGDIPVLPPAAIAEIKNAPPPRDRDGSVEDAPPATRGHASDEESPDATDATTLRLRLQQVEAALETFRSEDVDGSNQAWNQLEQEQAALRSSLEALDDATGDDPGSGESATGASGNDDVSSGLRPTVEALSDDDDSVRFAAIASLSDRLDRSLLPAIEQCLTDSDCYVRSRAVEYYAQLTGQDGTPRLVEALSDDDESVRFAAITSLADRLDRSLLPAIEQRLTDPDSYVRSTAVEYYAKLTEDRHQGR